MCKKEKEGGFSPALVVAASHDCEGGGVGGCSLGLSVGQDINQPMDSA